MSEENKSANADVGLGLSPLFNRVVIEKQNNEDKTEGGLFIPNSSISDEDKTFVGTVLAVGPGLLKADGISYIPMHLKAGDVVIFSKFGGTPVRLPGKQYYVVPETEVLAKLNS